MIKKISEQKCFDGTIGYYSHEAKTTNCEMKFTVFMPPNADNSPVLYWLSGLTCTEDNFTTKAGAYKLASELGMAIVVMDTSPRGDDVPDEDGWDFAKGAGFYIDAIEEPWVKHYNMYSYVTEELPNIIEQKFAVDGFKKSITGHSMGGYGALMIYLRNADKYCSVSAFAPIAAPMQCAWGQKAFSKYLGVNKELWKLYDTIELLDIAKGQNLPPILIDQGAADGFLVDKLKPEIFDKACKNVGQELNLRMQDGYDHSFFFIQSFIDDHLRHHAKYLF